jgi:hypothetical protein
MSTTTCYLCAKDLKRSDNLNRHLRLCHADREEYVGYKACTDFTFLCVGADYPHLFVAEKKGTSNQYAGYCTGCYKAVPLPQYTRTFESACKHMKDHMCVGKQVRTYTKTVKSEDVSGNTITKTEMQTGAVKITEEMIKAYKKQLDMQHMEYETNESCDIDVQLTIENAFRDSSKLRSPAMKAALAPKPAESMIAHVSEGDINWETVCKELCQHRQVKRYLSEEMAKEKARIHATVEASLVDSQVTAEELDWYDFMVVQMNMAKMYTENEVKASNFDRQRGDLEDAIEREKSRVRQVELKLQQECQAAARREAERDEEIRNLRAALQQCQSKIELVVDDKKF